MRQRLRSTSNEYRQAFAEFHAEFYAYWQGGTPEDLVVLSKNPAAMATARSTSAEDVMWDERYRSETYAYGKAPNDFLKDNFRQIPKGRVLSIAEGEGRNAVFLAQQGYSVTAVDASRVGLDKAAALAHENGVTISLIHADLASFDMGEAQWDGIVSIFCPLPSALRRVVHQQIVRSLKPGGIYLLEAYRPAQIDFGTGGGKSVDTMVSQADLRAELPALDFLHLAELERNVIEGSFHTGLGAVVQAIAKKR